MFTLIWPACSVKPIAPGTAPSSKTEREAEGRLKRACANKVQDPHQPPAKKQKVLGNQPVAKAKAAPKATAKAMKAGDKKGGGHGQTSAAGWEAVVVIVDDKDQSSGAKRKRRREG